MLKSSEHEKLWRHFNYEFSNFQDCSEFYKLILHLILLKKILRIGGPAVFFTQCSQNFTRQIILVLNKQKTLVSYLKKYYEGKSDKKCYT